MSNSLNFELDDPTVTAELSKKRVTLIFCSHEDAEKFYIMLSESARLGAKFSMRLQPVECTKTG